MFRTPLSSTRQHRTQQTLAGCQTNQERKKSISNWQNKQRNFRLTSEITAAEDTPDRQRLLTINGDNFTFTRQAPYCVINFAHRLRWKSSLPLVEGAEFARQDGTRAEILITRKLQLWAKKSYGGTGVASERAQVNCNYHCTGRLQRKHSKLAFLPRHSRSAG